MAIITLVLMPFIGRGFDLSSGAMLGLGIALGLILGLDLGLGVLAVTVTLALLLAVLQGQRQIGSDTPWSTSCCG